MHPRTMTQSNPPRDQKQVFPGLLIGSKRLSQREEPKKRAITPNKTAGASTGQSPLILAQKKRTVAVASLGRKSLNPNSKPVQLPSIISSNISQQQGSLFPNPKNTVFICRGNNDKLIREYFASNEFQVYMLIQLISLKYLITPPPFFNYYSPSVQLVMDNTRVEFEVLDEVLIQMGGVCQRNRLVLLSRRLPDCINTLFIPTVNHIQNIGIIATKSGLVQTVKDFEIKEKALANSYGFSSSSFMPETYRLDVTRDDYSIEEQNFLSTKNTGLWINKPTNFNCGRGIQMISDIKKFKDEFIRFKSQSYSLRQGKQLASAKFTVFHKKCIIQKYLESPLLLDRKKFDMRVYVFIASTNPLCVLYNPGYLRLSMNDYKLDNADDANQKFTHLTNAAIQKKHPNFEKSKENTIWSVEKFEKYVSNAYGASQKQIEELRRKIKSIFTYIIRAAEKKLDKKTGCFELLGCDILIGSDFTPYLIEMNHNPALHLDTQTQSQVIPQVVQDALDISISLHSKPKEIEAALRDNFDTKGFQTLINESTGFCFLKQSNSGSNSTREIKETNRDNKITSSP